MIVPMLSLFSNLAYAALVSDATFGLFGIEFVPGRTIRIECAVCFVACLIPHPLVGAVLKLNPTESAAVLPALGRGNRSPGSMCIVLVPVGVASTGAESPVPTPSSPTNRLMGLIGAQVLVASTSKMSSCGTRYRSPTIVVSQYCWRRFHSTRKIV